MVLSLSGWEVGCGWVYDAASLIQVSGPHCFWSAVKRRRDGDNQPAMCK